MSKTLRIRKNGTRVYEIRISRGRDPLTGKQLTPYSMIWPIPENYSAKRTEKEAAKVEAEFAMKCKAGEVLTKQEAIRQRTRLAQQEEQERLEYESKPTFSEYTERYLKRAESNLAASTIETYSCALTRASGVLGNVKMEAITKGMIRKYIDDMQADPRYKWNTVARHYAILKAVFLSAIDESVIDTSPMTELKRPRKPKDEKNNAQDKAYSEEEVAYIIECLNNEPLQWKTLMMFMLDTGCRRGEVAGLKWESVNLETGETEICNNRQYTVEKGIYDTTPKSGKSRTLFLNPPVIQLMKAWKREQTLYFFSKGLPQSEYCFNAPTGEGMRPSNVTRHLIDFGRKYGIRNFHPHTLRHTMATISIANGADVVSISRKLGHYSPSLTLSVYSHANDEAQKRANKALADAIYQDKDISGKDR